jgi:hypothetical protein
LPGRNRRDARKAFLVPIGQSLSCITRATLLVSEFVNRGEQLEALALSEDPLKLKSAVLGSTVQLQLRHQYRIVKEKDRRQFHVSTAAYFYRLDDEPGNEIMSWHWHPGVGVDHPHLHVSSNPAGKHAHLPTGRVSIESVLRMLIDELGVPALKDDYATVLKRAEDNFIEYRRWHG